MKNTLLLLFVQVPLFVVPLFVAFSGQLQQPQAVVAQSRPPIQEDCMSCIAVPYPELSEFLSENRVDENVYHAPEYTCVEFSEDLIASANSRDIAAWKMYVLTDDGTHHSFVAFLTTDRGPVWIEPETDAQYTISYPGESLCDSTGFCLGGKVISIQVQP